MVDGVASVWDNDSSITLHPESGSCATFSNSQMIDKISQNMNQWESIPLINLDFNIDNGAIGEDITIDNYTTYIALGSDDTPETDSLNPVVYDDDGSIVSEVFGSGNEFAVLGFAGPDALDSSTGFITDGQALLNCLCLEGNVNIASCEAVEVVFSSDELDFTMVHEVGHMIGFDHTQVNQDLEEDTTCDLDSLGDCNDIPTMYPLSVDAADQISPTKDDQVIALTLYGSSGWEDDFCTVTGELVDVNGVDLRCADVQAVSDDESLTVSVISGALAVAEDTDGDGYTDGTDECLENCGAFTLVGLKAGETYTITVKPIDAQWTDGSGINPCNTQLSGIVEEEIATIEACAAGSLEDLGIVETLSEISTATDDTTDDGADTSSESTCGEGKDFTDCDPLISCSLSKSGKIDFPFAFSFFMLMALSILPLTRALARKDPSPSNPENR